MVSAILQGGGFFLVQSTMCGTDALRFKYSPYLRNYATTLGTVSFAKIRSSSDPAAQLLKKNLEYCCRPRHIIRTDSVDSKACYVFRFGIGENLYELHIREFLFVQPSVHVNNSDAGIAGPPELEKPYKIVTTLRH